MFSKNFEDPSRNAKSSLRGLIRIGRSTDDYRFSLEQRKMLLASLAERAREDIGSVLLHEDVALEGEPRRHRFVPLRERIFHPIVVRRSFHHVPMRVAGVAVRTSKRAPDIRIDRPETHPRSL